MGVRPGHSSLETERRIQMSENKCLRKLLCISYWKHKTNDYVWNEAKSLGGQQEPLLSTVKWQEACMVGHVTWHNGLCKTVMQGTVKGRCRQGWQCKTWSDNIKAWTNMSVPQLLTATADRASWSRLSAHASSALRSPQWLDQSREWHDMTWNTGYRLLIRFLPSEEDMSPGEVENVGRAWVALWMMHGPCMAGDGLSIIKMTVSSLSLINTGNPSLDALLLYQSSTLVVNHCPMVSTF